MTAMLSVVIPTLNAAGNLDRTLDELAEGRHIVGEIIVADGGSDDGTWEAAARSAPGHALTARKGHWPGS